MEMLAAFQTWNAGHRHPGATFKNQHEAQAAVHAEMKADPELVAALRAEHARVAEITAIRKEGCIITADRHRSLTAMLAAHDG
jgi:hypothetical protein